MTKVSQSEHQSGYQFSGGMDRACSHLQRVMEDGKNDIPGLDEHVARCGKATGPFLAWILVKRKMRRSLVKPIETHVRRQPRLRNT
jgi:hypothetical protein